jgi:DUF4097 and DUF4098 domain-containing protein YvlB
MRRGSIIGPLVLIAIGLAFLVRNLWPDVPVLDFLGRNWPYILIAWGALRLVELFTWTSSGKPLPVSGVSGGEWTLIVILCLFGSGLHQFSRRNSTWLPRINLGGLEVIGESYEYPYATKTAKAPSKAPRIVIESFRGDAQITGTDSDEVKVSGLKTMRALESKDAEKADKESILEVITQGDQIIIRCNQDRADSRTRITSKLDITVPRGASIDARGRYGDFDIRDINGQVEIYSDNAGVRLDNIGGNVKIDLRKSDIIRAIGVKGDVELKGRGDDVELENISGAVTVSAAYSGTTQFRNLAKGIRYAGVSSDFQFEKINGEVRSTISNLSAENVVGPVRINSTKAKDVQISDFTQGLEISVDRGDIEVRPGRLPLSRINVSTMHGDVDFSVPGQAKFDLRATANRGEISNDYGDAFKIESSGNRGQILSGTVGTGGVSVVLNSNRGGITVRKGDVLAPPAAPPAPPSPAAPPSKPVVRVE